MEGRMNAEPINRHQRRADAIGHDLNLPDVAYTTTEASAYTGLALKTLEGYRTRGGGPLFVRYGRKAVRYRRSDLDNWMNERTLASTSEAA
jgi:predicted DNA-binding transcriptional regulator AlpA